MARRYDQHIILKTLDNSPRILFWDLDEFLVMIAPLFIGMIVGSFLVMVSGILLKPAFSKAKRRFPRGRLQHRMYWLLPTKAFRRFGMIERLPASHIREFIL